jgi:RNA polymerase sigma-70 factor, ECF subfamily
MIRPVCNGVAGSRQKRVMRALTNEEARSRFDPAFACYSRLVDYARRRAAPDAEAVAAETLEIAWRRIERVPADDPLPWLYRTAAHVLSNQRRAAERAGALRAEPGEPVTQGPDALTAILDASLDPALERALRALSPGDRELLLLIAWEDLTPAGAAAALRISRVAARVRLLRARRRFQRALAETESSSAPSLRPLAFKEES